VTARHSQTPSGGGRGGGGSATEVHHDTPVPVRLGLQRQARSNLRRHVAREAVRVGGLLGSDLVSFLAMRAFVRALRDGEALGAGVAHVLQVVLARGILNGWQFGAALVIGLVVTDSYGPGDRPRAPRRLFAACALATAMPMWAALWTRGVDLALLQYAVTTALVWIGLVGERLATGALMARLWPPRREAARTLFVGAEAACREAMASDAFAAGAESRTAGFIDVASPPAPDALGPIAELPSLLHAAHADTVVVCGQLGDVWMARLVETTLTAGCRLLVVPRSLEMAGVNASVVWQRGQALFEITTPALKGRQLLIKRAVDLAGAMAGLVVAAPVMLLLAAAIRLDSPGPVIFGQERIGTGGRRFRVLKFRTMRHGASDAAHRDFVGRLQADAGEGREQEGSGGEGGVARVYKLVDDERVTRVGRWLRRTSLDELPQLFNVVRGEMSLVGPRPPLPYEFEAYDHWQFDRLQVRPGITGLWQVSGRNRLSYRQMCELDVEYVRRWSLGLDMLILLKTVPVVLFNSGRAA
jgi:exopolysaccharide biosynthesis polyprenyl glycosylphosphotransferase